MDLATLPKPSQEEDRRVWALEKSGGFSTKSARHHLRDKFDKMPEARLIWSNAIHPSQSAQYWKLMRKDCCATATRLGNLLKAPLMSICMNCRRASDDLEHLLWDCSFAQRAWDWIGEIFRIDPDKSLLRSFKKSEGRSKMIRDLWLVANVSIKCELWKKRNNMMYEGKKVHWTRFKARVHATISTGSIRLKGDMHNSVEDRRIVDYFSVNHRSIGREVITECYWTPPDSGEILICCDGASAGNPGPSGLGVVARNSDSEVMGTLSVGLGINTNYMAETYAILYGLEWARKWNVSKIRVRSDSLGVVNCFKEEIIPWFLLQRWKEVRDQYTSMTFEHVYREVNFAADNLAKRGRNMEEGQHESNEGRPNFLTSVEEQWVTYFRFT